jgi:CRP-like cAMP-binding protein
MLNTLTDEAASSPDLRQLLEELYKERTLYPYTAGQVIPMHPDEVWVVCRGVVQLTTLYPTGDEALLGLVTPSMPFGLPFTVIRPYQATAMTDVDVMRLTMTEIDQSSTLTRGIFQHLSRRLRQTEAFLTMVGHRRVKDRLCELLTLLGREVGQPVDDGVRLGVRLTHQHLANAIGTTRVTVTRLLGQLREERWLVIDRNHYIVLANVATAQNVSVR